MADANRTAEVLAIRARRLAEPLETARQEGERVPLLGFEAGGDRFGLPSRSIVTVLSAVQPTPVPGMPSWVLGAVGVQGRVVGAISPDHFLGTRPASGEATARSTAVVVADEAGEVALMIDRLDHVKSMGANELLRLPAGTGQMIGVAARGTIGGRLILDPAGLIAAIRSALQPMTGEPSATQDHRPIGPT